MYGYSRNTAPTLSELATRTDVTVFENAFATTAWTLPSHTSLFTGLPTVQHGVYDEGLRINSKHTLANHLSTTGYDTAAFLNNGWLTKGGITEAFDERFNVFNSGQPSGAVERNLNRLKMLLSMQDSGAEKSIQCFREWIDRKGPSVGQHRDIPFFAFFHLMEPHYLYNPMRPYHKQYLDQSVMRLLVKQRQIYTERGRYLAGETSISERQMSGFVDLYDSEIRYLDSKIQELFNTLRQRNQFNESLIIIVGDHGELFGEHNLIGHHFSLAEEILRVPLIVKWPDGTNPVEVNHSESFVSLADIFNTVTGYSSTEASSEYDRNSLEERHRSDNKQVFAHYRTPESMLDSFRNQTNSRFKFNREYDTKISVVRECSEKLVVSQNGIRYYDLDASEDETKDQSSTNEDRVVELQSLLDDHLAVDSLAEDSENGFSGDVEEQLESLGYI
jgi:arylsulfatase A-like enzyme